VTAVASPPVWIVLVRDVTEVAPVDGLDETHVSLVLDLATGLLHGAGVGATAAEARVGAMRSALTSAVGPASGQAPERVVCPLGQAADVRVDLAAALPGVGQELPIEEAALPRAVDEVMDELVEHFAGPSGPEEEPTSEEWSFLVGRTLEYARQQPWHDWPDELQLRARLTVGGESTSYVVAVIGREGLQAGLVLYPGRDQRDVIVPADDWEPDQPLPFGDGSLLLHLNPPDDTVEHLAQLAVAHGWPADGQYMPVWLSAGPGGFAELERVEAVRLGLALAAVLARANRRPGPSGRLSGRVALPGGMSGSYTVTDLA
jgi:hypothetical protein